MRQILCLVLAGLLVCACTASGQTPAQTVEAFFTALSRQDKEQLQTLMYPLPGWEEKFEGSEEVKDLLLSRLVWKIGAQTIENDLARVEASITAVPYEEMAQAYVQHVEANVQDYRARFAGLDEPAYQQALLQDRLAFYQAYTPTVTHTLQIDLAKQDGVWIVTHAQGLENALLGEPPS